MRLTVRHATTYQNDAPMRFVTQSHRLTPVDNASQTVVAWSVEVAGAAFGAHFVDGAGDNVGTMTLQGPVERIEILVEGIVETTDTAGVLRDNREVIAPRVYLRPTAAIKPSRALEALAARSIAGVAAEDVLVRAHRLAEAVAAAIAYVPGTTHSQTTAAEALERGQGVCQDQSHALIALAHCIEMPARYVVGYLLAGEDVATDQAGHAWAELHVPTLGWVGFDPANLCCPDDRYIRLGSGRDAREAAPIRGMSRGGGAEAMTVSVAVEASMQRQQ